ncbi:MmgE/PrpD family protein [Chloroflexota bacterium]
MGATEELAKFVTELEYESLTEEVVEQTKICTLDVLGSALFGSIQPWGKMMAEFARDLGGKEESTILGYGYKVCAPSAALANGTMGHSFELDDAYIPAVHHPGVTVIPAALAIGERQHSAGKDFITSVVAGYEVMNRVGLAVGETHILRGFFPTPTNGSFGAAAAAGKLLGVNANQMANALGIAGSKASGLMETLGAGAMTKRLGAGTAAENGVMAALLAQKGFTGTTTILEGEYGYLRAFSDNSDVSKLTDRLGKYFYILQTAFKLFPCCKALHAYIDAVIKLASLYNLRAEDVEEITAGGYEKIRKMHAIYEPPAIVAAQFSVPYTVAVAFLKGKVDLDEFTEKSIRDPEVLNFAKKVKIVVDPEIVLLWPAHEPGKITIRLKDGREYSETVVDPRGDPRNPIPVGELQEKFRTLVSNILSETQVSEVMKIVDQLENLGDISELTDLVCCRR